MNEQVELLDADDVAKWLRVSVKSVRRWAAAGAMPEPVRVGEKLLRWRSTDLAAWIDSSSAGGWEAGDDDA